MSGTMQAVFACGGKGTRLRPDHIGPESLTPVGGGTLLHGLISRIAPFHSSLKPPIVIVDQQDEETPRALKHLLPEARVVHQPQTRRRGERTAAGAASPRRHGDCGAR